MSCKISPGCRPFCRHWRFLVVYITPLVLLPLPVIIPTQEAKCAYVALLMAVYWCTEAVAIEITSIIPIFLFSTLGILPAKTIANSYLNDTTIMFMCGLMVALAIEKCNLHRRIAVSVLMVVGTQPLFLMLGFMLPTWFLSMWISNTATTAMMLPIMEAVLQRLASTRKQFAHTDATDTNHTELSSYDNAGYHDEDPLKDKNGSVTRGEEITIHIDSKEPHSADENHNDGADKPRHHNDDFDMSAEDRTFARLCKGMTLSVAYAANCGGIATLTGTPPNAIMKGFADDLWAFNGYAESPITFSSWIIVGLPVSALSAVVVWLWLVLFFGGPKAFCKCRGKTAQDLAAKAVIKKEKDALGPMSFAEIMVCILFAAMVLLWFFRKPGFMQGWGDQSAFKKGYVTDAVVSSFIAFVMCIVPFALPDCADKTTKARADTLLDWKTILTKLPWGVMLLLGGGFALAAATQASGLSQWIADQLTVFKDWPEAGMVAIISILVAFLTELTSNSATCTILMPIMASLAEGIGKNPLFLMFPAAVTTSFAFMLPVATPPNAIAFSYGRLRVVDMIQGGLILNFLCMGIVTLATMTWAYDYFDFDAIPWQTNATLTTVMA